MPPGCYSESVDEVSDLVRRRVRPAEPLDDLALPMLVDAAVARQGRHHLLVAEILAPGLQLLGRPAALLPNTSERVAEAVRVEVRQARPLERRPENASYRVGIAPVPPLEPARAEECVLAQRHLGS